MGFHQKNILGHRGSTILGLVLGIAFVSLAIAGVATMQEVVPLLTLIVPFLLYGPNNQNNGAAPMAMLLFLCLAIACSPQKRMQRLMERHPWLMDSVRKVTVRVDTIRGDTVRIVKQFIMHTHDSTTIVKDGTIIHLYRNQDSFKLNAKVRPCDTITRYVHTTDKVLVPKIEYKDKIVKVQPSNSLVIPYWLIALGGVLAIGGYISKIYFKL